MWWRGFRRVVSGKDSCGIMARRAPKTEGTKKVEHPGNKERRKGKPARKGGIPRSRRKRPGHDGPAAVALETPERAVSGPARTLIERIRSREAKLAVIGLGYVGLPLACEFARGGFTVHGIDVDASKVSGLIAGRSHVQDVPENQLRPLLQKEVLQ